MASDEATTAVLRSDASVSDKIRALGRMGLARADIARLLGKRYQHVRNVLEAERVRAVPATAPPGLAESLTRFETASRLVIGPGGVLVLPRELMESLGLKAGGVVIARREGDRLVLIDGRAASRRAVERLRTLLPPGPSMADELIAERRAEAARDG